MQFFERSAEPPPKFFRGAIAGSARRRLLKYYELSPKERAQTRFSDHALELTDKSVAEGLKRLFRGKCAFCESQDATFPYRFRPSASSTPEGHNGHLYYTWLANTWENIYPICLGCIPRQPEYFPIAGKRVGLPGIKQIRWHVDEDLGSWRGYPIAEEEILIDPCRNEPFQDYFFISISGELKKQGVRGALTIEHFKLNREDLVSRRKDKLRAYREALLAPGQPQRRLYGAHSVFNFSTLEFGGLWYLQCQMIIKHLARALKMKSDVSREKIAKTFRALLLSKDFSTYRDRLLDWIEVGDFGRFTSSATSDFENIELFDYAEIQYSIAQPTIYPSLVSIELTHFKAIEYLKLQIAPQRQESSLSREPVQPAMLILGENATGKSSILEAMALALSDKKTRALLGLRAVDQVLEFSQLGSQKLGRMPSMQVRLGFDDGPDMTLEVERAIWKPQVPILHPPVFAYGAFRQYQKGSTTFNPSHSILNLFDSSRLLPNPETWLLSLKGDDLNEVTRALRFIMAIEEDIKVIEKSADKKSCLIVMLYGRVKVKTPLSQASSGYRSVLAMACDIMRRLMDRSINPYYQSLENARAIVLIDEVEAHLHPRWKIQIMSALRKALPKVTFIVTSHDPLCVRGMHNGEVVVLHRTARALIDGSAEKLAQIEQLQDLPDISQLTIEQLLTSDFFSLASTDQPIMNLKLAQLADLLSASYNNGQLDPEEKQIVAHFKEEINEALPVGTTEGQRLVQEAVAEFLQKRITASRDDLKELDAVAKGKILAVLEGF